MKKISYLLFLCCIFSSKILNAQIGYFDAPYTRYEADLGTLINATATAKSYAQGNLQSEASDQVCVNLSNAGASVAWTVAADGDGLVVRYSVPDGQSAVLEVFANSVSVGTMNLSTNWSWEYLSSNGNPNNVGVVNTNPKMRFDEVRMKLPAKILAGGNLKIARQSGNIHIDFAELEAVPPAVLASGGDVTFTGGNLQTFISANGGATIYIPAGYYNIGSRLNFDASNTTLKGAGMWYTQLNFTSGTLNDGGLWGRATNISYIGLFLTTDRNSRGSSYKAINGVYTSPSTIKNLWVEHFECGAWIAQYETGPAIADGFVMSNCRFRNNYADGTNLCKGTSNAIVEHCNFRNNGDDDMAIWPANNQSCNNNTFRYNTSENCWRASGCAIYGGLNNQAHHLLIKDNLEVGLRVGNNFGGDPFNAGGLHQLYNIRIISCGTYNDLFNAPVGAIDILCTNVAGNSINNVKFSCIEIIDSKNDAIYIDKKSGNGFNNLIFENITINGTGKEYPNNSSGTGNGGIRGYGLLFWGNPSGNGTYCNISYANRGGNAPLDMNTSQLGTMSWTVPGTCPGGCTSLSAGTIITSPTNGAIFNGCPVGPISITANSTAPSGNTISYIEFFVDGISIGTDNTSTYSMNYNSPADGYHALTAVAHYTPSNTTSTSTTTTILVGGDVKQTGTAPVINGSIETLWNSYVSFPLNQGAISAPDLDGTFKIMYDATNLYLLVDITDDVLRNDNGVNNWEEDGIEVYIDMGNNKSATYGANDFQYGFLWNSATIYEYKHTATAGVVFAQANRVGGYTMEIRIPWTTLGGAPSAGAYMGFDVKINDDDDGGTRENELSWYDGSFGAWNSPALFGTLQFANCGPLPVKLLSFSAVLQNESVELEWRTSSEINNKKFIVERSQDGYSWVTIAEVYAIENPTEINVYNYIDLNPKGGENYYRLHQLDKDGRSSISSIIQVRLDESETVVFPNPFFNELAIKRSVIGASEIVILDLLGNLVYQKTIVDNSELVKIYPDLPSGIYFISITSASNSNTYKIVRN